MSLCVFASLRFHSFSSLMCTLFQVFTGSQFVCVCAYPVRQRGTEASRSPHSPWSGRTDCRRSSAGTSGRNQQRQPAASPERGRTCPPTGRCLLGAYPPLRGETEDSQRVNEQEVRTLWCCFNAVSLRPHIIMEETGLLLNDKNIRSE